MDTIKVNPTKTKVKHRPDIGKKINLEIKGQVKNKNVLKGKPLKGSNIKATANYNKGKHSVSGEAKYKPDSNEATIVANYNYKFSEGGEIVADQYTIMGEE